jgi:hypothetical protein
MDEVRIDVEKNDKTWREVMELNCGRIAFFILLVTKLGQ